MIAWRTQYNKNYIAPVGFIFISTTLLPNNVYIAYKWKKKKTEKKESIVTGGSVTTDEHVMRC